MAENVGNKWSALLNGAIDSDDTSIAFDSAVGTLPSVAFRIVVQDAEYDDTNREIMLVTAGASTPLTVTRAQEGTTGVAHADNSYIVHVLTAGGLSAYRAAGVVMTASGTYVGGTAPSNGQNSTLAANSAYFRRTIVPFSFTPTLIGTFIKTSSGNIDLGVYADDGTGNAPGARIASLGSTASPGTGTRVFSLAPGLLTPGVIWLAAAANNTTFSIGYEGEGVVTAGLGGGGALMGSVKATAFPLPDPAGAVSTVVSFAPFVFLEIG